MKELKKAAVAQPGQKPAKPSQQDQQRLPWSTWEQQVVRMQKQIAQAHQHGERQTVYSLQLHLMESEAARLLAVRRVTGESQGKDTPGVDGVKSLTPAEQLAMASAIHPANWKDQQPGPVRRVWIPKPGTSERHPTFVYRSDIEGAFDHIDQSVLLDKLETSPVIEHLIRGWLKAGIMDDGAYVPSEVGVAQGGVLSPLLLNITLHGMEEVAAGGKAGAYGRELPLLVRYGDDFVILHTDLQELQRAEKRVQRWLATLGLQLQGQKTRISHTMNPLQGEAGFDFLGFNICQVQAEKQGEGQGKQEAMHQLKTIVNPSKEAIQRHNTAVEQKLRHGQNASQAQLIQELNPLIVGWTSYYNGLVEAARMSHYDEMMDQRLLNWASRRNPGQTRDWLLARYWRAGGQQTRTFATADGLRLRPYRQTSILTR